MVRSSTVGALAGFWQASDTPEQTFAFLLLTTLTEGSCTAES